MNSASRARRLSIARSGSLVRWAPCQFAPRASNAARRNAAVGSSHAACLAPSGSRRSGATSRGSSRKPSARITPLTRQGEQILHDQLEELAVEAMERLEHFGRRAVQPALIHVHPNEGRCERVPIGRRVRDMPAERFVRAVDTEPVGFRQPCRDRRLARTGAAAEPANAAEALTQVVHAARVASPTRPATTSRYAARSMREPPKIDRPYQGAATYYSRYRPPVPGRPRADASRGLPPRWPRPPPGPRLRSGTRRDPPRAAVRAGRRDGSGAGHARRGRGPGEARRGHEHRVGPRPLGGALARPRHLPPRDDGRVVPLDGPGGRRSTHCTSSSRTVAASPSSAAGRRCRCRR